MAQQRGLAPSLPGGYLTVGRNVSSQNQIDLSQRSLLQATNHALCFFKTTTIPTLTLHFSNIIIPCPLPSIWSPADWLLLRYPNTRPDALDVETKKLDI
jgi:hypothetical protein